MSEKIFNARFAQKYDTLTAWASSNIVLKAGEIAFATESVDTTVDGVTIKQPIVLAKIGDGSKTFSQLPYSFYAKASDVHGWAKKNEEDFLAWMAGFIGEKVQDTNTNTTYKFDIVDSGENAGKLKITATTHNIGVADTTETSHVDIATQAELDKVVEDLTKALNDYKAEIEAWKVTNTEAIAAAKSGAETTAANALATARTEITAEIDADVKALADGAVKTNTEAIATEKERAELAEAALLGTEGDAATANTIYGVKAAIAAENERATGVEGGLNTRLTATEGVANAAKAAIDAFLDENAATDEVVNTLKEIQAGLDAGEESAASLLAEINKIKGGETVVSKATHAASADEATHAVNADTATNAGHADTAGDATKLNGQEASYYAKAADLAQEITDRGTAITNLTKSVSDTYETKVDAQNMLTNISTTIDNNKKAADEGIAQANNYTSMVEGQVTELNNSLAPVAKSGEIADLKQSANTDEIIFDAGNASGYSNGWTPKTNA